MAVFKLIDRHGRTRIVDAKSALKAIQHVFTPDVEKLSASAVAKLAREYDIEEAAGEDVSVTTTTKEYGGGEA